MAKVKEDVTVGNNPMDRKYLVKIKKIFKVRLTMLYKPNSNMTSFKRFGFKPVVKYAYIGISADRQRHNLFWLFKYRICPIRIEIIHGVSF